MAGALLEAVYCIACFFAWVHLAVAIVIFVASFLLFILSFQFILVCLASCFCTELEMIDPRIVKYMNLATKRSVAMFVVSVAQLGWALLGIYMYLGAYNNGSVLTSPQ